MSRLRVEFRHLQFFFGIALTIFALMSQNVMGQASYTAQVRGTVTDQTGAVVQGATVTITNDGTNVSTTCALTVELSAARVGVWTWHFIPHACAPAIC